jgi:hypothetical protein
MATSSTYSNAEMAGSTVLTIPLMASATRVTPILVALHVFVDKTRKKHCQDKQRNDDPGKSLRRSVTVKFYW